MIEQFYNFQAILHGIIKIFVLLALGYALYVRRLIKKDGVEGMNSVLYWICLPALIISSTTATFSPSEYRLWWLLPAISILMTVMGFILGDICLKFLPGFRARRELVSSLAFQNVGYLPMALTAFICSGPFCSEVLLYIFLFLMGFNITMWSIAPAYLSGNGRIALERSAFLNPSFLATIFAIVSVFMLGKGWVPPLVQDPLKMIGDTTFPLALVTLGASLAEHRGYHSDHWPATVTGTAVKLLVFPLVTFLALRYMPLSPAYKFFIFLESTMPSAVTLIVVGQYKKADVKFLSGMIFYTHLAGIITIPLALYLFERMMPGF